MLFCVHEKVKVTALPKCRPLALMRKSRGKSPSLWSSFSVAQPGKHVNLKHFIILRIVSLLLEFCFYIVKIQRNVLTLKFPTHLFKQPFANSYPFMFGPVAAFLRFPYLFLYNVLSVRGVHFHVNQCFQKPILTPNCLQCNEFTPQCSGCMPKFYLMDYIFFIPRVPTLIF